MNKNQAIEMDKDLIPDNWCQTPLVPVLCTCGRIIGPFITKTVMFRGPFIRRKPLCCKRTILCNDNHEIGLTDEDFLPASNIIELPKIRCEVCNRHLQSNEYVSDILKVKNIKLGSNNIINNSTSNKSTNNIGKVFISKKQRCCFSK